MKNLLALLLLQAPLLHAQEDSVYRALKTNDSLLFTIGFNNCDIQQFETLLSEGFEFYHDEAGIMESKVVFITSVKDGLCKLPFKPKRVLKEGSLQVFPMKDKGMLYGAVQTGEHSFYAAEEGKPEHLTSTAHFTHFWLYKHGEWQLARVFSYGHIVPKK